jgi:hypothetical protein
VLNTGRFTGACRIVTVLCPFDGNQPRITSVHASANPADTAITICLADGREVEISE